MSSLLKTLARCGTTGALVQSVDWAATPLGAMEAWPKGVAVAVELVMAGGFPLGLALGPRPSSARMIYNEPFIAFLGHKHPAAMGRRAREVWPEVWDFFAWALGQVWRTSCAVTGKDLLLRVERGEQLREIHASISFSPIFDDTGGPCGALVCAIETTEGVLSARREHALRRIGETLYEARTEEALHRGLELALASASRDIVFALFYEVAPEGQRASLRAAVGIEGGTPESPREVELSKASASRWSLQQVVSTRESVVVAAVGVQPSAVVACAEPPRAAVVVPVMSGAQEGPLGVLVVGLNPALTFDGAYEGFVRLVAREIAASLVGVRSLQEANRRADALDELDRAKTRFLTNISHEFRTPLTLVLGPLEDLLDDRGEPLSPEHRAALQGVRRNAYRVLRHVTTLLDFARSDAGRSAVELEPTDLAALTRDTAGALSPAVRQAGLRFHLDCPPTDEPVFVAREMWEQIVLNLVANALKFTFAGEIAVSLYLTETSARLTVRDTGTGIPEAALPHIFERFYRVPDARARTHEGIGVGLSLVKELVALHGGAIEVHSVLGEGSTFTVDLPRGARAPGERRGAPPPVLDGPGAVTPFLEDARGWLAPVPPGNEAAASTRAGRILVVEDSDEMRAYLARILGVTYEVEAVPGGAVALARARESLPDLVVADVVLPDLDGLGLLRALRAEPRTGEIPVVLLSARGGEDALVDALDCGADDYLVKPFSARELRARVRTHLDSARARREAGESRLKDVFLGLASHELRTPLTCLKLNVQLVHRDLEKVDPRLAARLAGLHRAIDRMTRLVDEMLNISSISAGKLSLRAGRCDLGEICRSAVSEQAQVAARAVTLSIPGAPISIVADEDRLGQVVANLLANAFKYSAADRPVALALSASEGEATVTVRDEGAGIPAEERPHLFERFYRAPNVSIRSGSYVGLGLGLYLAKAIVEQHGGRIWVESVVGQGSAFSFTVPLAA